MLAALYSYQEVVRSVSDGSWRASEHDTSTPVRYGADDAGDEMYENDVLYGEDEYDYDDDYEDDDDYGGKVSGPTYPYGS